MAWQLRGCALATVTCAATLVWACGGEGDVFSDTATTAAATGSGGASTGATTSSTDAAATTASTTVGAGGGTTGAGGSPPVCSGKSAVPGDSSHNIAFDGNDRDYDVQVPASYDGVALVPLVFDFHGYTGNKGQQRDRSGFAEVAEAEGFVVVYPNGFGGLRSWNAGDNCCGQAQMQDIDDVGLVRAIAAEVMDETCIDPKRVYATGLSNGAAMSHRLACEAADLFAAVAPVSYPLDFDPFSQCVPSRPVGVMHSHGTSDIIVPYNGSFTAQPTPDSFAYWASANGCSGDPAVTYDNGNSSCETYDSCMGGVKTTLCTVSGGHILYGNNDDVPIAELSWAFLSEHVLP